jgi:hypothetical protein
MEMPGVQQVEDAVRQDERASRTPDPRAKPDGLRQAQEFRVVQFHQG